MSNEVVISVENISKQYRLGEVGTGTLRHDFNRWWHKVRGKEDPYLKVGETNDRTVKGSSDYVWALKDINFEVKRGEVLGIIGRNGAGKSTLLKILSRVTTPTTGEIKVKGRIASLLEVGTGFNPELTGRDNIYLNGAILGMRQREIARKFDEIVAFAEVERYIDTPVKRYSSGMYVRLAFAVAAHLEPEILIVDEVLAVGDFSFQQKCLGKMQDVAGHGRTVLFVSHNMQAVTTLCSRAILLKTGQVIQSGVASDVSSAYLQMFDGRNEQTYWCGDAGDDTLRLKEVRAIGGPGGVFYTDENLRIQLVAEILKPATGLVFAIEVYSNNHQLLAYTAHDDVLPPPARSVGPGTYAWEMSILGNTFAAGTYEFRTDIGIHNGKRLVHERVSLTIAFENIKGIGRRFPSGWTNCFRPDWVWRRLLATEIKTPGKIKSGSK